MKTKLDGLELIVDLPPGAVLSAPELGDLRGNLLRLGMELGVDLAVQRDDMFRRSKRLVCMDVDSTFVKGANSSTSWRSSQAAKSRSRASPRAPWAARSTSSKRWPSA